MVWTTRPLLSLTLSRARSVKGNNPVINYKEGGTVTIPVNFVYTPEMMKSDLYLDFNVVQGKKVYTLPAVKVGEARCSHFYFG